MDLSEFLGPFFEEAGEMLQQMESDLLALDAGDTSALEERIGSIFRVAHSIKGGAGTFGFSEITAYTHQVEFLLDAIRAGRRAMTPETVRVLLESVDVMRNMLDAARDGVPSDAAAEHASLEKIRRLQAGESIEAASLAPEHEPSASAVHERKAPDTAVQQADDMETAHQAQELEGEPMAAGEESRSSEEDGQPVAGQAIMQEEALPAGDALHPNGDHDHAPHGPGWRILFRPRLDFASHGSDPLAILRELAKLGALHVRALAEDLPPLPELNPRRCHLGWEITLIGDIPREQVEDVFAWVMDQAELHIEPLPGAGASPMADQVEDQEQEQALETLPEEEPIEAADAEPPLHALPDVTDDSRIEPPTAWEAPGEREQDHGHGPMEAAEAIHPPSGLASPSVPAKAAGDKTPPPVVEQARA